MLAPEAIQAAALLELRKRRAKPAADATQGWRHWLQRWFPLSTTFPFAPRHERLWAWLDALRPGVRPDVPHAVEIWPRGGGKSSTAELGATYVGTQYRRRFVLYVSGTQGQANKHVQSIAHRFEMQGISRATGSYGNSLGWRMDLLRVTGGFNVLALGLDAAARGIKLDDFRPDLIIFDDIDDRLDSPAAVAKKIVTITQTILPTGGPDVAVLVIQNIVHPNSIVAQLADHRADFLHGAAVHQEPAVVGLEVQGELLADGTRKYRVTAGTPTWEGQDVATVASQIGLWGRIAFMREAQHDMTEVEGGLWNRARDIDPFRIPKVPKLARICVSIDPNVSDSPTADEAGITVQGVSDMSPTAHGYLLEDATVPGGPLKWSEAAIAAYHRWQANDLVAEKNNGGEMVRVTLSTVAGAPTVTLVHAARGKLTRAEPIQKLAEEGRIHHVGVFVDLERELCTWQPGDPSPNRLDAMVHGFTHLMVYQQNFSPSNWATHRR